MSDPVDLASPALVTERVARAFAHSPYRVDPTATGFDVSVHLSGPAVGPHRPGRRSHAMFVHRVEFDGARRAFTVTDEMRTRTETRWGLGRERSTSRGRSKVVYWNVLINGVPGTFRSEPGRRQLVDLVAASGWTLRMARSTRIGLIVGLGGAGLALLVALAVVVLLLFLV